MMTEIYEEFFLSPSDAKRHQPRRDYVLSFWLYVQNTQNILELKNEKWPK